MCWLLFLVQDPSATAPEQRGDVARETQLLEAADDGALAEVKRLIEAGVAIEAKNRFGMTPLYLAARRGHVAVVRYLHEKGAKLDVSERVYGISVIGALLYDDRDETVVLEYLLDQKVVPTVSEILPLFEKKKTKTLGLIFDRNIPVGDTAVMLRGFAGQGNEDGVKILLEKGSFSEEARVRALDHALLAGNDAIIALLANTDALKKRPIPKIEEPKGFVGTYATERGFKVRFLFQDGLFKAESEGNDPTPLLRVSDVAYEIVGRMGATATFEEPVDGVMQKINVVYPTFSFQLTRTAKGKPKADAAAGADADPVAAVSADAAQPATAGKGGDGKGFWPSFRGPGARGVAEKQNLPLVWSEEQHVRWKIPIPGLAHAAPIIWEDRVFIVSAENGEEKPTLRIGLYGDIEPIGDLGEQAYSLTAFDTATGKQKWRQVIATAKAKNDRHPKSSHANATPVTDGKHLVVLLGSEGLFCFDMKGKFKWRKDLGLMEGSWFYDEKVEWGHGSSPVIDGDRVFLQVDRARDSFIAAYALKDGKELWRTGRHEIPSWSSPTLVKANSGDELVTNGINAVRAYDPKNGKLLWWLEGSSEIAVPTPFEHGGKVIVTNGYRPIQPIYVLKPGARGAIKVPGEDEEKGPHMVWNTKRGGPYLPTPVAYDGLLYVVDNQGVLTCYDLKDGKKHYRQRLARGVAVTASSLVVDGRLLVFSEFGDTFVVQTGPEFKLLARNKIEDNQLASPAVAGGLLYIRGERHLYAIGGKSAE
ncbi:outer membrane protein assembly factor BamB family protein [Acanthopleuribacter pedis]|nr:PQQ-binding-like beta-propeller repeat protein [Acanthopleuribacter pedis]